MQIAYFVFAYCMLYTLLVFYQLTNIVSHVYKKMEYEDFMYKPIAIVIN